MLFALEVLKVPALQKQGFGNPGLLYVADSKSDLLLLLVKGCVFLTMAIVSQPGSQAGAIPFQGLPLVAKILPAKLGPQRPLRQCS